MCCVWLTCICCRALSVFVGRRWLRLSARKTFCTCGRWPSFSVSPGWKISAQSSWPRSSSGQVAVTVSHCQWLAVLYYKCAVIHVDTTELDSLFLMYISLTQFPVRKIPPPVNVYLLHSFCDSWWSKPSSPRSSKRMLRRQRRVRRRTPSPWWTTSATTSRATCRRTVRSRRLIRNWKPWRSCWRQLTLTAEGSAGLWCDFREGFKDGRIVGASVCLQFLFYSILHRIYI